MSQLDDVVAAKVRDEDVSLKQLLLAMKVSGGLDSLLRAAINDVLVAQAAERHGISVSTEELQSESDRFRQNSGLEKASDTQAWLKQNNLDVEDFEARLERQILLRKLTEEVTQDKIEPHFAEHRADYDQAVLSHIVVEDENIAEELLSQIQEGEAELGDLARKHSVDQRTRQNEGKLGRVNRKALSAAVESAVFSAKAGDVVGPIKTDMGYHVIKVGALHLGELNDEITASVRQRLFSTWLAEEYKAANVRLTLAESL